MVTTQQRFHNTLMCIKWLRYAFQNVISMIKNSNKKNPMAGTITKKTKAKAKKGPKEVQPTGTKERESAFPSCGRMQSQSCFNSVSVVALIGEQPH
jgi:hypothetical protein